MSTAMDVRAFAVLANTLPEPKSLAYIGINRESSHLQVVRDLWPGCAITTIDVVADLKPDLIADIHDALPSSWDAILCSNVLMYSERPLVATNNLQFAKRLWLIIQEPVIRVRPKNGDLQSDVARFYDSARMPVKVITDCVESARLQGRTAVNLRSCNPKDCIWYPNPDGIVISAMFLW